MLLCFYALRLIRFQLVLNYYSSYSWGFLVTYALVLVLSCTFSSTCSCYLPDRKELQEGWEKEISTQIRLSNQALSLQHGDITDTSTAELKFAEECQEIQLNNFKGTLNTFVNKILRIFSINHQLLENVCYWTVT